MPLAVEAERLLEEALSVVHRECSDGVPLASPKSDLGVPLGGSDEFSWPPGVLHVLSVIDAGFASGDGRLSGTLSKRAGGVIKEAGVRGRPHGCKWAIEVAGAAPKDIFVWLIRSAFRSQRSLLREAAYRQIGRLADVPHDLSTDIRRMLITMSVGGQLRASSLSTSAQLKRIEKSQKFLSVKLLLLAIPWIDFAMHSLLLSVLLLAGVGYCGKLAWWSSIRPRP